MKNRQINTQKIGSLPLFSSKNPKDTKQNTKWGDFKIQLVERQRFRKNFCMRKKQVRNTFFKGSRLSKEAFTQKLFTRLDLVLHTLYPSKSLRSIRQDIRHGRVLLNGIKEKRPNYMCQAKDRITCATLSVPNKIPNQKPYAIDLQKLQNYFER